MSDTRVMNINLEKLASNIRFFRKQNEWTQQELAEQLKLSRSVIAKWENNLATPDIDSLIKLSHIFKVRLEHLVGMKSFHDDVVKEFKRIYHLTTDSIEHEVFELVEYLMTNPKLKNEVNRMRKLPLQKQKSVQTLLSHIINEYEQI